jgi:pyruvate,water dikinase
MTEQQRALSRTLLLLISQNRIRYELCSKPPTPRLALDMAEFLVRVGVDLMCLNPDTVVKATRQVLEMEQPPPSVQ